MKKRGIIILVLFLIVLLQGASAQTENEKIAKALSCLDNRVNNTALNQLSLEEAIFSALARVPGNKSIDKINAEKNPGAYCWPSSGCTVKETAQVALVLKERGQNITNVTRWLRDQVGFSEDLTWYLQITITNNKNATCFINYEGNADNQIQIDEKTQISGDPGNCLDIHGSKYRLTIDDNCISKQFNVRCEGEFTDFKTNLLYEESAGGTLFVSSVTHSGNPPRDGSRGSWTSENISAKCFKQNGQCDYEGTLWGAAAMYAALDNTEEFAPYLRALATTNAKYFPDSFLYYVLQQTSKREDVLARITQSLITRPNGGYWQMENSPYGSHYDTSLGMMALGGKDNSLVKDSVVPYLLEVQGETGCWNNDNIRDTAMIIYYSGWWTGRSGSCGNGVKEGAEQCDDGNLRSADGCSASCISEGPPQCNNNIIEGSEKCECGVDGVCGNSDDNLNGKTCVDGGYEGGNLTCLNTCLDFNYTRCSGEGSGIDDDDDGSGYDPGALTDCELEGFYCEDQFSCLSSGGIIKTESQFVCASHTEVCCTIDVPDTQLLSCAAQGGNVCRFDETCDTPAVPSSDGECCLGTCQFNGTSDSSDSSTDGTSDGSTTPDEGGSGWIIIVILLIVLIMLAIFGILFKDKLRVWWFKFRGKSKSSKVTPGSPPGAAPSLMRRGPPSFGPPRGTIAPMRSPPKQMAPPIQPRRPITNKDKEMEETLNKLKKISE